MNLEIIACHCATNQILPLLPISRDNHEPFAHRLLAPTMLDPDPYNLPAGSRLYSADSPEQAIFLVCGRCYWPCASELKSPQALLLMRLKQQQAADDNAHLRLASRKEGLSVAVVTLSDKGFQGQREDRAGSEILALLRANLPIGYAQEFLLPDDKIPLRALLTDLALLQGYDLICTSGGTGLSPRDITPQVSKKLMDMELPGFVQAMLGASLLETPNAAISRLACGTVGKTLLLNLPGSVRAVRGNLLPILAALPHALAKLQGEKADCGG